MRDVYIIGVGATAVTRSTPNRGRYMAAEAVRGALHNARIDQVSALYVGNMMSGILSDQQHMGPLIADISGLRGIEAFTTEAACASGGAAVRLGVLSVAGGMHEAVISCGVERMTHVPKEQTTAALATAADFELEGSRGESFMSLNARLMRMYMAHYGVSAEAFAPFAITAHQNALTNPYALFHKPLDLDGYMASKMINDPVRLMDASPICNGAAAVVIAGEAVARRAARADLPVVRIRASTMGTDSLGLAGRRDKLFLDGVALSTQRALEQAGVSRANLDIFELHDAYTIISVLSLEAAGFAEPGTGTRLGLDGRIGLAGDLPISTMGGLKARGHPVGATGVYQIVETYRQLIGRAEANQVKDATLAMVQNIGGTGATVVTHILERVH
jgi:acetyl-CoA C-acetyltransferase